MDPFQDLQNKFSSDTKLGSLRGINKRVTYPRVPRKRLADRSVSYQTGAEQARIRSLSGVADLIGIYSVFNRHSCNAGQAYSTPGSVGLAQKTGYLESVCLKIWIVLDARDTRVAVGRELTERNLFSDPWQTVPFRAEQPQNKP